LGHFAKVVEGGDFGGNPRPHAAAHWLGSISVSETYDLCFGTIVSEKDTYFTRPEKGSKLTASFGEWETSVFVTISDSHST